MVVLEHEDTNMRIVPKQSREYLFENEMGRPSPSSYPAKRVKDPTTNIVDNAKYDVLRPGVMVSSGMGSRLSGELLTSTGVTVKDTSGKRFITFHGFPQGDAVLHLASSGKQIRKIAKIIPYADIALVELEAGVHFENKTSESVVDGAVLGCSLTERYYIRCLEMLGL